MACGHRMATGPGATEGGGETPVGTAGAEHRFSVVLARALAIQALALVALALLQLRYHG